jgi:hypothetical protein
MRRYALVVVLALVLALGLVASVWAFSDVSENNPYSSAISDLTAREIISGYQDGTFKPDAPVWRQHFAKMIVLTFGLACTEADVCSFTDVEKGGAGTSYPDNFIAVCAANEITLGTSAGHFSPTANISRAQLVTMVVRAATRLRPGSLAAPPSSFAGTLGPFDSTHGPTMLTAEFNGLLVGLVGFGASWDPWASASRGEVAQLLQNLLTRLESPSSTTTTTFHPTTTTTTRATTTTTASTTTTTSQGATVYITDNGTKYHNRGCRYLKDSCIPISLAAAKAQGYTPCGVCKPPQ